MIFWQLARLTDEQMDRAYLGERWSIRGILKHVANRGWWYLDRPGPGRRAEDAADGSHRSVWPGCASSLKQDSRADGQRQVLGKEGEFWSPRKLLRRRFGTRSITAGILQLAGIGQLGANRKAGDCNARNKCNN